MSRPNSSTWPLLTALLLGAVAQAGCAEEERASGVLEGDCLEGEGHCVDLDTIQLCRDGTWDPPEDCPPQITGSIELPIEIETSCGDGVCRPGG